MTSYSYNLCALKISPLFSYW